jgi:hypothetical protein
MSTDDSTSASVYDDPDHKAMMTGPQHYIQAERVLKQGADPYENPADAWTRAQVHATLALAAAVAAALPRDSMNKAEWWRTDVVDL